MTGWRLDKWNGLFAPITPVMSDKDIESAANWLTEHNYPIPEDCPKNTRCPEFRPICLLGTQCRVARGMCAHSGIDVKCTTCGQLIDMHSPLPPFKDSLSQKEFGISGMCQKCQDKTFVEHPDPCDNCERKGSEFCKTECPI